MNFLFICCYVWSAGGRARDSLAIFRYGDDQIPDTGAPDLMCLGYTGKSFLQQPGDTCQLPTTPADKCATLKAVPDSIQAIGSSSKDTAARAQNVQAIQMEIMQNGPVFASYKVYEDFMKYVVLL